MADLYVKLGPKAKCFWCPVTETSVTPGKTVKVKGKPSFLIRGALEGGHLLEVSEKERLSIKPVAKMNKEELTVHIKGRLTEEEVEIFAGLTKPKMVTVVNNLGQLDANIEGLKELNPEEIEAMAKDQLDEADLGSFAETEDKVEYLTKMLPEYFDPFDGI